MAARSPLRPRKKPAQARSRATVDTIVEGAARVLVDEGYEGFNTNRVAEVAGVSVGSLYQYFPNKESLLAELSHRHAADLRAAVSETLSYTVPPPLESLVQRLVRNHIALHRVDPRLHHVLTQQLPRLGAIDAHDRLIADIHVRLEQLLAEHPETNDLEDPKLVLFISISTVESVVHRAIVEHAHALDTGKVERELTRLIVGFIRGAPRRGPPGPIGTRRR